MPDGAAGGGFTADPDAVITASSKLGIAADQLDEAGKALLNALAAQGECWGNDDAGKEFSKDYVPGTQGAEEGFTNLVGALRGMHGNVEKSMNALKNADDQAKDALNKGQ
jgi:hypothetical protein